MVRNKRKSHTIKDSFRKKDGKTFGFKVNKNATLVMVSGTTWVFRQKKKGTERREMK